ncbi:MAG: C40 family peptidase [Gemmatimonadales bacterium]|nr:C40 family peptidase [Gemmatimonadales bacterium]
MTRTGAGAGWRTGALALARASGAPGAAAGQQLLGGGATVLAGTGGSRSYYGIGARIEGVQLGRTPIRLGAELTAFQPFNRVPDVILPVFPPLPTPAVRGFTALGPTLTLFRRGDGFYGTASVDVLFGGGREAVLGWSAGAGYERRLSRLVSVGIETRYREAQLGVQGVQVLGRLALDLGISSGPVRGRTRTDGARATPRGPEVDRGLERPSRRATEVPPASASRAPATARAADIVATAREALGTRYQWGGTGQDGGGYDCSGLIQYAYARHGVTLPRQSRDQALVGIAVETDPAALQPGDILTFAERGDGQVTHVGLYLGEGRFIHSAASGVREDPLDEADPNGRWWLRRWVGVRRLL